MPEVEARLAETPAEHRLFRAVMGYVAGFRASGGDPIEVLVFRSRRLCALILAVDSPAYLRPLEEKLGGRLAHLRGHYAFCPEAENECLEAGLKRLLEHLAGKGYAALIATVKPPAPLEKYFTRAEVSGKLYWLAAPPKPAETTHS